MKKVLVFILVFNMIFMSVFSQSGSAHGFPTQLASVQRINPNFLSEESEIQTRISRLLSPLGDAMLYVFCVKDNELGYCITVDNMIVEFSESASPYSRLHITGDYLYYDFSTYRSLSSREASLLHVDRSWQSEVALASAGNNRTYYNQLSGVTPHLQGSSNCIVHALSELLWYWGTLSNYSLLISGQTFPSMRSNIDSYFSTYSNNSVPLVALVYGWNHGNYWLQGNVNWNPSYDDVTTEIDNGRPCMVGFAAGSEYSQTVGHMTMCYGYFSYSTQKYVTLCDGWSTGYVSKLWTGYNDCVISIWH